MKKHLWIVWGIVVVFDCCFVSGANAQVPELNELRGLLSRTVSLEKSLGPVTSKISPDIGKMKEDYEQAVNRIDFLKTDIIRQIETGLDKGDIMPIDGYINYIQAVPESDPARLQLLPLSNAIRSKLIFSTLTNRELKNELQERIAFLGKNHGEVTAPKRVKPPTPTSRNQIPIYIAFHWHMHQPIYWPYEDIVTTENRHVYSYSVFDVFYQRMGPYSSWPYDAVKAMANAGLPHGGAQVSFSGSLIENLEKLAAIKAELANWKSFYRDGRQLKTARGNPRLDIVAFGFHHPLMALIGYEDIKRQIAAHKEILLKTFGSDVGYSKGIFPPENAFAEWMIPGLVDSGMEWVMVDNIHFNRACKGYPWVKGENLYPPNPADQVNPNPENWLQLNGLWAPSKVSAWADRPHYVEMSDPQTGKTATTPDGKKARIIAVPTERYLGNEDGRGGFGALNYDAVMSQLLPYNNDPKHPILLVLHHDGDNYGGGSDGYYHGNFYHFIEWVKANPDRFVCTTVQDYLDQFPPSSDDVIHVEPGSWAGADNGDPEFLKWNGDPNPKTGYSPDRNSWGVMTACRNIVNTAIEQGVDQKTLKEAERMLMVSQTSCYEYWDGTEMWDSHPTRACNKAVELLRPALNLKGKDRTPPALYAPQRQPYNPGGMEWGQGPESTNFTVWSYAYDFGGLQSVILHTRVSEERGNSNRANNHRRSEAAWHEDAMTGCDIPAETNPKPLIKAREFSFTVKGAKGSLVEYYVSATDKAGNTVVSPMMRVYVGTGISTGGGGASDMIVVPASPKPSDKMTFTLDRPGKLHWGVNTWQVPPAGLWPQGTKLWADNKAVETPMVKTADGKYQAIIGPVADPDRPVKVINAVAHYDDNTWGKDLLLPIE